MSKKYNLSQPLTRIDGSPVLHEQVRQNFAPPTGASEDEIEEW